MTDEIVVVTGLPRSGTSMMMQLLAAGGIEPLTDGQRTADEDNPRGYYEVELVKKLKQDASWLAQARGKSLKVVSQHLMDLPPTEQYRVLFMRREIDEVLASQEAMIARRGEIGAPRSLLSAAYVSHLEKVDAWLARQSHMIALSVDYKTLVAQPTPSVRRICDFLASPLDVDSMSATVDPALYRRRA